MFDFQNFLLRFSLTELKPTQHTHDISKRTYQQPRPLTNMPIPPLLHCLHVFFYLDVLWQQNTTISVTGSNSQMNNCTTLEPPHTPPAINVLHVSSTLSEVLCTNRQCCQGMEAHFCCFYVGIQGCPRVICKSGKKAIFTLL